MSFGFLNQRSCVRITPGAQRFSGKTGERRPVGLDKKPRSGTPGEACCGTEAVPSSREAA